MPQSHYALVKRWMFDIALPWWAQHGCDRENGGFVEQMTPDGADAGIAFRRTRVTSRQIYIFAHGYTLGFNDGAELARHGYRYLTEKSFVAETGCFARTTTREGAMLDPTPDLYDNAFALFGFAWLYRATGDVAARDWAHRTLDGIEATLRDRQDRGFWHAQPASGWRQQNPHMHLTEAALAAFEATGDARFGDLASELAGLFASTFYDPATQTLGEFYADDWTRAPGDDGRIAEPGHQMEWSWILKECRRLVGVDHSAAAKGLVGFAERHGVDAASGLTRNAVRNDGVVLDAGSRTWPNTERLKSAVAMWEMFGEDPEPVFAQTIGALFANHLGKAKPGLWLDAVDGAGRPAATTVPASTYYHLFLAFAEVLRVGAARGADM